MISAVMQQITNYFCTHSLYCECAADLVRSARSDHNRGLVVILQQSPMIFWCRSMTLLISDKRVFCRVQVPMSYDSSGILEHLLLPITGNSKQFVINFFQLLVLSEAVEISRLWSQLLATRHNNSIGVQKITKCRIYWFCRICAIFVAYKLLSLFCEKEL